ncbi:MAG: MYXO-CTERM sorting domain-containing protein [Myxococcota bacterium]
MPWLPQLVLFTTSWMPAQFSCECPEPHSNMLLAPSDGQTGVPVNTRIWVGGGHTGGFRAGGGRTGVSLTEQATGNPVSGAQGQLSGPEELFTVFTPTATLKPDTAYEIHVGSKTFQFTTGSDEDNDNPAKPTVEKTRFISGPEPACGPAPVNVATFTLKSDGLVVVGDLDAASALDVAEATGTVSGVTQGDTLSFGNGNCHVGWGNAGPLVKGDFRFGVYDLAGNFSGWTATQPVIIPPLVPPCACTTTSDAEPLAAWAGLAGAFFVVVRRRLRR